MTGRERSATVPRPRRIAVSSAMLLVASPRYSLISRCGPSPTITTPRPARPGLPLHAPSVQTWIASAGAATASCDLLEARAAGRADGAPAAVRDALAPVCGAGPGAGE